MKTVLIAGVAWTTLAIAQHPYAQPRPGPTVQTVSADGGTTFAVTPNGPLPVGKNFLLTVDSNMFDSDGKEMLNTEPSRPNAPYNLMDTPQVSEIDPTSPTDDLRAIFERVLAAARAGKKDDASLQMGLDILEGNPLPARPAYSGLPLLHYTGPEKVKIIRPVFDAAGNKIGGTVDVHQSWFDSHIESDTSFFDPTMVQDVPWTINYTVDVLHRGADDFAPFNLFFDAPPKNTLGSFGPPHIAMDATFFPMQDGKRYVMRVKMPPGKYLNLSYTWGWRRHPPRVQVIENSLKQVPAGKWLLDWETETFGKTPRLNRASQIVAIAKIGELAPAKRMWRALMDAKLSTATISDILTAMDHAQRAFRDWSDRTSLPEGVKPDPDADITLFYANNTIYGNATTFASWTTRPATFKVTLLNGDHFVHGYINVDFGGARGWENQFQSSVAVGGTGCDFTFGRAHWWMIAGGEWGLIDVPPVAADGTLGLHKVEIVLNFEPSSRIRLYQFDPYHHDVAVYSLH
jgi:hypothetical protein